MSGVCRKICKRGAREDYAESSSVYVKNERREWELFKDVGQHKCEEWDEGGSYLKKGKWQINTFKYPKVQVRNSSSQNDK